MILNCVTKRNVFFAIFLPFVMASTVLCSEELSDAGRLFEAIKNNKLDEVQKIIEVRPTLVHARHEDGCTPLHVAAQGGRLAGVKLFIDNNVFIDAEGACKNTALHYAARNGHLALARLLVSHGANVNAGAKCGVTPLHFAAMKGDRSVAELLVSKGAHLNAVTSADVTPLYSAAIHGQLDLVKFLLSKGAEIDAKTKSGNSALTYLLLESWLQPKHDHVLEELVMRDASIKTEDLARAITRHPNLLSYLINRLQEIGKILNNPTFGLPKDLQNLIFQFVSPISSS